MREHACLAAVAHRRSRAPRLATVCLLAAAGSAWATDASAQQAGEIPGDGPAAEVAALMRSFFQEVWGVTRDAEMPTAQKRASVAQLVSSRLDYATLSRAALGPLAERFSREEYGDFSNEYSRYVTSLIVARVARHPKYPVEVESASYDAERATVRISGRGAATVSGIPGVRRLRSRERIQMEMLLRLRHGEWRVGAVKLNGVDVSRNFREQFQSVLQRSDPASLIAELRTRNHERAEKNPFDAKGS